MASYDLSDKTIVFRKLQAESGNECEVEARKKFPNAKSISSAQFFGYLEPKTLATTHFSSLVDIAGQTKRKIFRSMTSFIYRDLLDCTIPLDVDYLCDIRKELTELMQKLNGKDAKTIPIDTRIEWVDKMCDRVFEATEDIDPFREDEPIVAMMDALVDDAVTLRRTVLTHRREFITKK